MNKANLSRLLGILPKGVKPIFILDNAHIIDTGGKENYVFIDNIDETLTVIRPNNTSNQYDNQFEMMTSEFDQIQNVDIPISTKDLLSIIDNIPGVPYGIELEDIKDEIISSTTNLNKDAISAGPTTRLTVGNTTLNRTKDPYKGIDNGYYHAPSEKLK